eukprot:4179719-Amphidinium_carterae.1
MAALIFKNVLLRINVQVINVLLRKIHGCAGNTVVKHVGNCSSRGGVDEVQQKDTNPERTAPHSS